MSLGETSADSELDARRSGTKAFVITCVEVNIDVPGLVAHLSHGHFPSKEQ